MSPWPIRSTAGLRVLEALESTTHSFSGGKSITPILNSGLSSSKGSWVLADVPGVEMHYISVVCRGPTGSVLVLHLSAHPKAERAARHEASQHHAWFTAMSDTSSHTHTKISHIHPFIVFVDTQPLLLTFATFVLHHRLPRAS